MSDEPDSGEPKGKERGREGFKSSPLSDEILFREPVLLKVHASDIFE